VHKRLHPVKQQRYLRLIAPEAARWHDGDQFVEIEIDDRLQCLAGSALLKVFGQRLEPLRVLALKDDEFGDGIAPALSAAASVGRWPVMVHRPGCGTSGAMAGLSLGIGQRSVAEGLAGHGAHSEALRNGTGIEVLDETAGDQAQCSGRQLSLPLASCWLKASKQYGGHIGSSSGDFRRLLLAQAVAAELQAMSVMDDAVEDGVGEGRFAD